MRKIEILIVVVVLLALAALVGCKDEAEASEHKHIEGQIAWLDKMYIFNGYDYVPVISDKPEPDEPKCKGHGVTAIYYPECHGDPNEPMKVSLDFVSTWPDYIELEKDLVIDIITYDKDVNRWPDRVIPKGTKIYLKE